MRILAIDYGEKRIGLAISDEDGRVAVPFGIIENAGVEQVREGLKKIVREEHIGTLLVGMPMALEGKTTNPVLEKVRSFIEDFRQHFLIPIETIDERFTTKEAERRMEDVPRKFRAQKDALAATIMLQEYLDQRK